MSTQFQIYMLYEYVSKLDATLYQRRLYKNIIGSSRKLTWVSILTFMEDVVDEAHLIITNLPDQKWNC